MIENSSSSNNSRKTFHATRNCNNNSKTPYDKE